MSYWLFGIALAFVAYAAVSKRLSTSFVTGPMFFVTAGLFIGAAGLGIVDLPAGDATVTLLFEVTLAVVLFSDATTISSTNWREESLIPGRLLAFGLPLTIAFGTAAAVLLFTELGLWEAAILGAILAPTDASLGQAVVSNPRVPIAIRQALNVESGLNDGIVLPIVLVFLGAAEESFADGSIGSLLSFIGKEVVIAAVVGFAVGWLGGRVLLLSHRQGWISPLWLQIGALSLAAAAYGLAVPLGGSGFIAAWVTGLVLGNTTRDKLEDFTGFAETLGSALTMTSFLLFGAVLLRPAIDNITWTIVLYSLLSLTLIRILPVGISLVGSRLSRQSIFFLGWFGPRGLATIILAGIIIEESTLPGTELIVTVAMTTVAFSVYLHGMTAWYGSESYADWTEANESQAVSESEDVRESDVKVPVRFRTPGLRTHETSQSGSASQRPTEEDSEVDRE